MHARNMRWPRPPSRISASWPIAKKQIIIAADKAAHISHTERHSCSQRKRIDISGRAKVRQGNPIIDIRTCIWPLGVGGKP